MCEDGEERAAGIARAARLIALAVEGRVAPLVVLSWLEDVCVAGRDVFSASLRLANDKS